MSALERRVRLSTYVLFVQYGEEVEVQHTVRGTTSRIDRATYDDLLRFCSFQEPDGRHAPWLEAGVLVPPFRDQPDYHGGLRPSTEARLGHDYQQWYWRHEVESEREYRWLGYTILKMPSDLFLYQELITHSHIESVLEVGSGEGGALWFFASVLAHLSGGLVVGVDRTSCNALPPFDRLRGVRVALIHGDAHEAPTMESALALRPEGFGLVVLDADPTPEGKLALLERWAQAVAPGGYLVAEDVESPNCRGEGRTINDGIDRFLLRAPTFEIVADAARIPLTKGRGAVIRRAR